MAIPRVNRQPRQPQYPVEVDTGNPITRGLVRALVCEAAGIRDLMLGTGIAVTGTYIPQATESGYGRRNNTITRANYTLVDARTETVSAITIVWAGVVHRVGGTTYPFFRNQQTIVQATGSTGPLWSVRFGAANTVNSTTPIRVGAPTTYVYRKDGAVGSLFVDGVPALLNVTGGTTAHSAAHGIDGNVGFAQSNDITTNVMLIYDRPLSDAESRSLSINPWQVFRPVQRRVYFDVAAGGGATSYTVAADVGNYSLTGVNAGLTYFPASAARSIVADAGVYSLIGGDALLPRGFSEAGEYGSYAGTGQNASLKVARLLSGDFGEYTLNGSDAALTASGAVAYNLAGDFGQYAITGVSASLIGPADQNADTHDGYFAKQWLKAAEQSKRKIEALEDQLEEIQEQIEEVKAAPEPKRHVLIESVQVPPFEAKAKIIEALIEQAARIRAEIDDEEVLLLL